MVRQYGVGPTGRRRLSEAHARTGSTTRQRHAAATAARLLSDTEWQRRVLETAEKVESLRNVTTLGELHDRGRRLQARLSPFTSCGLLACESVAFMFPPISQILQGFVCNNAGAFKKILSWKKSDGKEGGIPTPNGCERAPEQPAS